MDYWWAVHDKFSIQQHPGWIWNTGKRMPQYFGRNQIKEGSVFVLAANRDYDWEGPSGVLSIYGMYEVTEPSDGLQGWVPVIRRPEEPITETKAWVIKGKRVKNIDERWRVVPKLKSLGVSLPVRNRTINPLTIEQYQAVKQYLLQRKAPHLGIMDKEPEYEQEVIAVFARNMEKVGYKKVVHLSTQFPDAILLNLNGKEEEVEFELYASGLQEHEKKQPKKWKQVTYICWENDLRGQERYKSIRIIALAEKLHVA